MTYEVCWIDTGSGDPDFPSPEMPLSHFKIENQRNLRSPQECYSVGLSWTTADVLLYFHTDVEVYSTDWLDSVQHCFLDDSCVAVGFGGATSLGNWDLYRKPYQLSNMARGGYGSNTRDAETHGLRIKEPRQVAVLDAFFMAVDAFWLKQRGGWPEQLTHHCLDLWLACEAARDGKTIYTVPVDCLHRGGAMSVGGAYQNAKWLQGGNTTEDHERPHRWLWDEYRDVLPIIL